MLQNNHSKTIQTVSISPQFTCNEFEIQFNFPFSIVCILAVSFMHDYIQLPMYIYCTVCLVFEKKKNFCTNDIYFNLQPSVFIWGMCSDLKIEKPNSRQTRNWIKKMFFCEPHWKMYRKCILEKSIKYSFGIID